MAKVELLALAAGLPRTDLVAARLGAESAGRAVLEQLFPGRIGDALPGADLLTASYPEYGRIYAGTFGPTVLICGQDLIELADLAAAVAPLANGRNAYRLQVNSVVDSVAMEILAPDGDAVREVMLVAEEGVIFDIGPKLSFEGPFWSGRRDPDGAFLAMNGPELPFDPVEFGEQALRTLFGFVVDADPQADDLDPHEIQLHGFVIAADSADPSDMASVRSGRPAPALSDLDSGTLGGAAGSAAGTPPTPAGVEAGEDGADPASGGWWQRLKRSLFGS